MRSGRGQDEQHGQDRNGVKTSQHRNRRNCVECWGRSRCCGGQSVLNQRILNATLACLSRRLSQLSQVVRSLSGPLTPTVLLLVSGIVTRPADCLVCGCQPTVVRPSVDRQSTHQSTWTSQWPGRSMPAAYRMFWLPWHRFLFVVREANRERILPDHNSEHNRGASRMNDRSKHNSDIVAKPEGICRLVVSCRVVSCRIVSYRVVSRPAVGVEPATKAPLRQQPAAQPPNRSA